MDKLSDYEFGNVLQELSRLDRDEMRSKSGLVCKALEEAADRLQSREEPANEPLTLGELRQMDGQPVWIEILDRPDLSRWHFIVKHPKMGIIAKDGLGQYECYPHNADRMVFSGCYFDIEHGHNYGVNWLAYRRKPEGGKVNE